jgi:hypothetical protein
MTIVSTDWGAWRRAPILVSNNTTSQHVSHPPKKVLIFSDSDMRFRDENYTFWIDKRWMPAPRDYKIFMIIIFRNITDGGLLHLRTRGA